MWIHPNPAGFIPTWQKSISSTQTSNAQKDILASPPRKQQDDQKICLNIQYFSLTYIEFMGIKSTDEIIQTSNYTKKKKKKGLTITELDWLKEGVRK